MSLVELNPLLPSAIFDLRYGSTNNITGYVLYEPGFQPRLDESAAAALVKASDDFTSQNLRLVIWDGYRPKQVQAKLLLVNSDPNYVLDEDSSNHVRGLAIDLTLADEAGQYLDMGTDFDDFTPQAHASSQAITKAQSRNRALLTQVMTRYGFKQWPYEWWHFDFHP